MKAFKKLRKTLNYYLVLWKFKAAKKEAERMHKITGKRYWVIQLLNKYHVLSSADIKDLKRQKVFRRDLDILKLTEVAAYRTR